MKILKLKIFLIIILKYLKIININKDNKMKKNEEFGYFEILEWNGKTVIKPLINIKIIDVDLDFFIRAVEENNKINNAKWSQWYDSSEIIETYTSIENVKYNFTEDINYIKSHLDYMIKNFK